MKTTLLLVAFFMSIMSLSSKPLNTEQISDKMDSEVIDETYSRVDVMPQFQDHSCMTFTQWVKENMEYPDEAKDRNIEGTVVASFIVDTLGNVTNIEVLREIDPSLAQATIELLSKSPQWIPGEDKGVKRRVRFVIPISYKFSQSKKVKK